MKEKLARLLVALVDWAYELTDPAPVLVQVPTIGRIVWFNTASGAEIAAIITDVASPGDPDSKCDLTIFPANAPPGTKTAVPHNPRGEGWTWPA